MVTTPAKEYLIFGRGAAITLAKNYSNIFYRSSHASFKGYSDFGLRSGHHSFKGVTHISILVDEWPLLLQRSILILSRGVATTLGKWCSNLVAAPFLKQKWLPLVLSLLKGFDKLVFA